LSRAFPIPRICRSDDNEAAPAHQPACRKHGDAVLERHGHGGLDGQNRQQLLAMSAATIDQILAGVRASATGAAAAQGLNGD